MLVFFKPLLLDSCDKIQNILKYCCYITMYSGLESVLQPVSCLCVKEGCVSGVCFMALGASHWSTSNDGIAQKVSCKANYSTMYINLLRKAVKQGALVFQRANFTLVRYIYIYIYMLYIFIHICMYIRVYIWYMCIYIIYIYMCVCVCSTYSLYLTAINQHYPLTYQWASKTKHYLESLC